MNKIKTCS